MQQNLFGGEDKPIEAPKYQSEYQKFKLRNNYRDRHPFDKIKNCGTCEYSFQRDGGAREYRKCELMGVTSGQATDISYRKICDKWKVRE